MKSAFDKILAGAEDAVAIATGTAEPSSYRVHVPTDYDVRALRKRLNMTQAQFGSAFGFGVARVRDWEQGRTRPDASSRAFLLVIEREIEAVRRALRAA